MNKIKNSGFFRIISSILIITFISLDIAYAYPPEHNPSDSTLATPSLLQQQPVNEHAARFQQSMFSQGALLASVYDIGEYFFGRPEKDMESLPSRYAEEVVKAGLGKLLGDSGIEILNIVPVEYLKRTVPEKLKTALSEIGFNGILPDEGVVFILYRKGDKKFLVQIAKRSEVSAANLPGYEWVVSDKYVVKYVPEDYKEPEAKPAVTTKEEPVAQVAQAPTIAVTPTVETKEAPKVTITEPIVEIELPKTETEELSMAPARKLTIRAIIASAMFVMLLTPYAFAGTSGADGAVTLSFNPFLSGIFIASAAIIASIFFIRYLNAFTTAPHPTKPHPKMAFVAALGWIAMMSFMPTKKGTVLLALMTSFPIGFELFAYFVSKFGGINRKKYAQHDTAEETIGAVLNDCAGLAAEGKILKANLLFKSFFETPIETKVKSVIFGGPFDALKPIFSEGAKRFSEDEVAFLGHGQQYMSVYHMLERANRNRSFFKKIGRASSLIVVAATAFLIPTAAQSQGVSAFPAPSYSGIGFGPQYMGFGEELLGSAISTAIVMGVSLMIWLIAKRVFKRDFRIAFLAVPLTVLIMTPFHPITFAVMISGFIYGSVPFFKKLIPSFMLRGGRLYKSHPVIGTTLYTFLIVLCATDFSYSGGFVLPLIGLFMVSLSIAAGLTKDISKYRSLKMSDVEKQKERIRLRQLFEESKALSLGGKVMEAMMAIRNIDSPLLPLNSPHFDQKMHEEFIQMMDVVRNGAVSKIREEESPFVMEVEGVSIRIVPVHKKQRMVGFANALPFEEKFILIVDLEDLAAEGMGKTGIRGMEPVLAKMISAMRKDARLGMFRDIGSELVLIRMEALAPVIADRKYGGMGVLPDKAFKYDTLEAKIKEAGFRTLRTDFFSAPGSFINFSFVPPGIIAFGAAASTNAASKSLSEFIGLGSGEGWYMTLFSVAAIMAAGQAVMWAIGKLLRLRKGVSTLLTIAIAVAVLVPFDAKLAGLSLLGFFLMYFEGRSTKVGLPWSQGFAPVRLSYTDYRQWADEAVASVKDGNAARYLNRSDVPSFLKRYFKAALLEARMYKIAPLWAFLAAIPYIALTILFYPPQANIGYIWFGVAASMLGWGVGMLMKYIKGHPNSGSAIHRSKFLSLFLTIAVSLSALHVAQAPDIQNVPATQTAQDPVIKPAPAVETSDGPKAAIIEPIAEVGAPASMSENAQNKPFNIKGILNSVFDKTYSINPFAVGLGVVGLASIFSAVKDFAFAHPVIAALGSIFLLYLLFKVLHNTVSKKLQNSSENINIFTLQERDRELAKLRGKKLAITFDNSIDGPQTAARLLKETFQKFGVIIIESPTESDAYIYIGKGSRYMRFGFSVGKAGDNTDVIKSECGPRELTASIMRATCLYFERLTGVLPKESTKAGHLISLLENGNASREVEDEVIALGENAIDDLIKSINETNRFIMTASIAQDFERASSGIRALSRMIYILGRIKSPRGIKAILDALADSSMAPLPAAKELARVSSDALVEIGNPSIPYLKENLNDSRQPVRSAISSILSRIEKRSKGGSTTLMSINPFAAIFGVAVLGSIFSAVKDFAFAHPVIAGIAALGTGIAAFLAIWRVFFPKMRALGEARTPTQGKEGAEKSEDMLKEKSSNAAKTYYEQGVELYNAKDYKGALAAFTNALRQNSRYALAYEMRGMSYFRTNQLVAAIADFDAALALTPNNANLYFYKALAYENGGENSKALENYKQAIILEPSVSLAAYLNMSGIYHAEGDYVKARQALNCAIAVNSSYAKAYFARGLTYAAQANFVKAEKNLNKAIELGLDEKDKDVASRVLSMIVVARYSQSKGANIVAIKSDAEGQILVITKELVDSHVLSADMIFLAGNYDAAIAEYTNAIGKYPNSASPYYSRGLAYVEKGEIEKAIEDYSKAVKKDPAFHLAYTSMALAYGKIGKFNEAVGAASKALTLNQGNAETYRARAFAYLSLEQPSLAIADLTKATELNPGNSETYLNRGAAHSRLDEHAPALDDYTKALELNPNSSVAYRNRGATYESLGQTDKAIADYTKAIELNPNDVDVYRVRGLLYLLAGDANKALQDLNELVRLSSPSPNLYRLRAAAYNQNGDFIAAADDATNAIALDPNNAMAYAVRASAYEKLEKYDKAIEDAGTAIRLNPDNANFYNSRAVAYNKKGRSAIDISKARSCFERALQDANRAIELRPDFALAYYDRGLIWDSLKNLDEAMKDLTKAIELNPNDADFYFDRGTVYAMTGQYEKAIADYDTAVVLNPTMAKAYQNRGNAYYDLGRFDLAIIDWRKTVESSVMEELAIRKEMSHEDLFTLVQSKVPASMESLASALIELEPLSKQANLIADAVSEAIAQAKAKHALTDDETRILWLALTGPGQGMGNEVVRQKESDDLVQPETAQASKTTQLFEIVESAVIGRRVEFVDAGNKIIDSLAAKSSTEAIASIGTLDKKMATAEIKQKVERAIAAIESMKKEDVTPETKVAIELLKKNLNQLEADGAVASLIALARRAKREDQKLLIGLETDWIPAINEKNSLQRNAITALMKEIDSIGEALRSMGLDNVEIIRGSSGQLAGAILSEAGKTNTGMRNIVVMASADTINSDSFSALRNTDESDRPFLAGIDPAELVKLYAEFGESVSKQLHIRLSGLLYLTLELAAGKEPPQTPMIVSYDKKLRIVIFLPRAELMDYEALKNNYAAEKMALQAA